MRAADVADAHVVVHHALQVVLEIAFSSIIRKLTSARGRRRLFSREKAYSVSQGSPMREAVSVTSCTLFAPCWWPRKRFSDRAPPSGRCHP